MNIIPAGLNPINILLILRDAIDIVDDAVEVPAIVEVYARERLLLVNEAEVISSRDELNEVVLATREEEVTLSVFEFKEVVLAVRVEELRVRVSALDEMVLAVNVDDVAFNISVSSASVPATTDMFDISSVSPERITELFDVTNFVKFVGMRFWIVVDETVVASTAKLVLDEVAVIEYPSPSIVMLSEAIRKQVPDMSVMSCVRVNVVVVVA